MHSGIFRSDKRLFFNCQIQSNTVCPRDLLSRTELFVEMFLSQELGKGEERFKSIKEALLESLRQPFSCLETKYSNMMHLAFQEDGNFSMLDRKARILDALEMKDVITFANAVLSRSNRRRIAVVATGNTQENQGFIYSKL